VAILATGRGSRGIATGGDHLVAIWEGLAEVGEDLEGGQRLHHILGAHLKRCLPVLPNISSVVMTGKSSSIPLLSRSLEGLKISIRSSIAKTMELRDKGLEGGIGDERSGRLH
jgi:hypothetical protein